LVLPQRARLIRKQGKNCRAQEGGKGGEFGVTSGERETVREKRRRMEANLMKERDQGWGGSSQGGGGQIATQAEFGTCLEPSFGRNREDQRFYKKKGHKRKKKRPALKDHA